MKWPVFGPPEKKPRPKLMAEILRDTKNYVSLPRQVRHAIERDRRMTPDEARDVEQQALEELREVRKSTNGMEALVAGSKEEMKQLYSQLKILRFSLKQVERAYLYHYFRCDIGQRMLAKVQKVAPGVSSKKPIIRKDDLEERIAQLSLKDQETVNKLLGR